MEALIKCFKEFINNKSEELDKIPSEIWTSGAGNVQ